MDTNGRRIPQDRARSASWRLGRAGVAAALLWLTPSCSSGTGTSPTNLDAAKVSSVVVGRSSRTDVFAILGRPRRTEQSAAGEAWIYDASHEGGSGMTTGVAVASGVVGAFVPYAGLVGSGLGLVGTPSPEPTTSLTVAFRADGVVRDCIYASTAAPAGIPGTVPPEVARRVDCQRPGPAAVPLY